MIFIGGFFILLGSLFTGVALHLCWQTVRGRSWPQASGRVLRAEVKKVERRRSSSNPGGQLSVGYSESYVPYIEYDYVVGVTRYRNDQFSPGLDPTITEAKVAQELLNAFPVEGAISVFYNPDDPKSSFLKQSSLSGNFVLLVVGVLLFGAGAALCFM